MSSPQINLSGTGVLALVAVAGGAYLAWRYLPKLGQVGDAIADTVSTKLNPASDKNLAYAGVNALGAAMTGDKAFNLGSWSYDALHTDPADPTRNTFGEGFGDRYLAWVRDFWGFGDAGSASRTPVTTGDFARMDRATYVDPATIPQPATFSDGVNRDPALDFLPQGYLYAGTF